MSDFSIGNIDIRMDIIMNIVDYLIEEVYNAVLKEKIFDVVNERIGCGKLEFDDMVKFLCHEVGLIHEIKIGKDYYYAYRW